MLILDGTIGADAPEFLTRMQESSLPCSIVMYKDWLSANTACCNHNNNHNDLHPEGIIYLRVSPEIACARIQKRARPTEASITLAYIQEIYREKEQLFIENKNSPAELSNLPVLVLNGNIDFQADFAQFYNHLFYIKRLMQQIQDKKEILLGTYKEKTQQRRCC